MKLITTRFAGLHSCYLLLGIALALCFTQVSSTTNETDKLALLAFKTGIDEDPFGVLNSWNDSIGFCQWYGVTCGKRHRRVTILDLGSQGLSGSISPHIGNLSFLSKLSLENNSLHHEIPPQVGRLRRLRVLGLHNNSLVGEIPKNISGCSNLVGLILQENQLTGKIPGEVVSPSNLRLIAMCCNNLIGSLPSSIGNLSSIEALMLGNNNLDGSIPEVLGHLANLQRIHLGFNELSGTIPSSFFNLSSLVLFSLGGNRIQGTISDGLCVKLPDLERFSVSRNQLEGPLPRSISNCTNLDEFHMSDNRFSGNVPSLGHLHKLRRLDIYYNHLGRGKPEDLSFLCSLTNNTKLEQVIIGGNEFGGVLPKCIGNLSTTLISFVALENKISGEIPKDIGNLVNLQRLEMEVNQLSGVVPSNLGNLPNLMYIDLSDNYLGGTIPSSLGNLTKLITLVLSRNNFGGVIPPHLSNCQALLQLDLSDDNLSGTIPPKLIGLPPSMFYVDLSHNHLTGVLPMEVGNLTALTSLDISNNFLVSEIPSSLGACISLISLRLGRNFFYGSIPQSIKSLKGIEELDLSSNNLSGQIPEFLSAFRLLTLLNLSYNKFEGMLPRDGVFENATSTSIIGNDELCGGLPEFHLPECISKSTKSKKIIVILSTSIIFVILLVAVIISFIYLYSKKMKVNKPASSWMHDSLPKVSYGTLVKMTNGFSSTNLIGVGSFGSIYKGILEDVGTLVAVKVLHLARHGALKSFMAECKAFQNIKHRNLLKIWTVCSGTDYQGNDFKALVYEFMDNGSLEVWLHPSAISSQRNELPKRLNFIRRISIAIDVASALNYLHHECHFPILHCDMKPSNILLDAEMVAHVGDFGLAKFLLGSSLDTIINQMSSVGLRGTIGYAPPEYAIGCEVSREGDVYSYGIILLEIFTGLSPTDNRFRDNLTLHSFVAAALPERVLEVTDRILLLERDNHFDSSQHWLCDSNVIFQECLAMIYDIGVACSNQVPGKRMSISGVANQLQKIRERLFALGLHEQDELP